MSSTEITGNPNVGFTDEDVDGDFDPAKYDEAMKKIFTDDYYEEAEDQQPNFDDELDDIYEENWNEWQGPYHHGNDVDEEYEPHYGDPGFNMDADYDPNAGTEESTEGTKASGGKRKSKFSRALNRKKPLYDPDEKTFEEYFDEYYKLDYEDIIGDQPCRFKYRPVVPNDYGLNTGEILTYPDKELNQWVSVKKMSQYRSDFEEHKDVKKYRKLSRDEKRRVRIFASQNNESETAETLREVSQSKRTGDRTGEKTQRKIRETQTEKTTTCEENLNAAECRTEDKRQPEGLRRRQPEEVRRTVEKRKQKSALLQRMGWKKRLTSKEQMTMAKKKRLSRQFKGASQDKLAKLSAERLSAYGLKKKKR